MKYILLDRENTVVETIPETVSAFPDIPISKRYPKDFLDHLIPAEETVAVGQGWVYDPESETFSVPPVPVSDTPTEAQRLGQQITDEQLARIAMGQQYTELELAILGGTSHV